MRTVAVNPTDIQGIPFDPDCHVCIGLRDDPQPGLAMWVSGVGSHMSREHEIELVGA